MKNLFIHIVLCMIASVVIVSCKSKDEKPAEVIIVEKPKQEVKQGTQSMQETNSTRDVQWLGSQYQVVISRKPDQALPLTKDEYNQDYYDNVITLRVMRADGSEAINHAFHKSEFLSYITDGNVRKNGALLGVVFEKVEQGNLVFAASVGSPNDKSDEYVPLIVHINRLGAISVSLDTTLDGNEPGDSTSQNYDDEGV